MNTLQPKTPTRQDFLDKVNELRHNWGNKTWWTQPGVPMKAWSKVVELYFTGEGFTPEDADLFDATQNEFTTRFALSAPRE